LSSSFIRTVCGSKFQTNDVEKQKARLEKIVLVNGWTSSGVADERRVQNRVPTPPGKSWIFFLKIPGPGKSWKITLVLESPGN